MPQNPHDLEGPIIGTSYKVCVKSQDAGSERKEAAKKSQRALLLLGSAHYY